MNEDFMDQMTSIISAQQMLNAEAIYQTSNWVSSMLNTDANNTKDDSIYVSANLSVSENFNFMAHKNGYAQTITLKKHNIDNWTKYFINDLFQFYMLNSTKENSKLQSRLINHLTTQKNSFEIEQSDFEINTFISKFRNNYIIQHSEFSNFHLARTKLEALQSILSTD